MQGLNSSGKQSSTQYACSKENVPVLVEVEVIESLYAAMSSGNKNSMDQSGVIEVTIIRPGTVDSFVHFPQNSMTLSTELPYRAKPYGRPATRVTDRCRIPLLDRRRKNSFVADNPAKGPAINVGEIVGDLPSKVTSKPRIMAPEMNRKLRHGDHCDSFILYPEISCAEIDQRTGAADPAVLKSYVNFCDTESEVCDKPRCINPLVYQVRIETEATQQNHPLVELSAAKKILEAHEPDGISGCNARHQIIEAMRKTLTEWGSDERRITDTLCNDISPLMKCEHCGVISLKKARIPSPKIGNEFPVKVGDAQQLRCGDDEKFLTTPNTESFCEVSPPNSNAQIPRNESNENIPGSKSSTSVTGVEAVKDKLKERVEKRPENSSQTRFHSLYYNPDTKLSLQRPANAENIYASAAVDTVTAERDRDSIAENAIINMIDAGQKKELKTMPHLVTTDRCGRCLLSIEKKGKSNDAHLVRNSYSTRYSPRQITVKGFKKPTVENTCQNNRNRSSFETGNSRAKTQNKVSTQLSKDCKEAKTPIFKNHIMDNSSHATHYPVEPEPNTVAKCKNKLISSIPKKLGRTSLSKNVANYMVKGRPSAIPGNQFRTLLRIDGEPSIPRKGEPGERSLVPSKINEAESQSTADCPNNLRKNLLHCCTASSDDKLSTDQEYEGNNHISTTDNDNGSFISMKNRKLDQISPDFNHSAPSIGPASKSFGNKDFIVDRYLGNNSSPTRYNAESETTAFSSSSSENVIREGDNSLAQVPRFPHSNDESSCDALGNVRVQIDKAIEKCSNYNAVVSKAKIRSHETLAKPDNSLKLEEKKVLLDVGYNVKRCERFDGTNCSHNFSANGTMTSNNSARDRELKFVPDNCRDEDNNGIHMVGEGRSEKNRNNVTPVENTGEKNRGRKSETRRSQENFNTSKRTFFSKQKYVAIRTPVSKVCAKSWKDPLKMTYKNPASVISSSSEYSNEYHQELGVQQRSFGNGKSGSNLQLNESEMFERQITCDEISSKDISKESKESLETKALPVYRKILESKDEMDWETFQQLVGTLHPSQRELWCDICKAVSNEAKRVAGETGASTEVCIEINPIPTSQTFSFEERTTGGKTSDNEISFEMDMVLTDSETFLKEQNETLYEPEKCH